jgi:hypothetical protein
MDVHGQEENAFGLSIFAEGASGCALYHQTEAFPPIVELGRPAARTRVCGKLVTFVKLSTFVKSQSI